MLTNRRPYLSPGQLLDAGSSGRSRHLRVAGRVVGRRRKHLAPIGNVHAATAVKLKDLDAAPIVKLLDLDSAPTVKFY